ncbi:MAG: hypothetical protein RIT45_2456 [Pseudomonadota bacterium]
MKARWRRGIVLAIVFISTVGCSDAPAPGHPADAAPTATGSVSLDFRALEPHFAKSEAFASLGQYFASSYAYQVARSGARWAVVATTSCDDGKVPTCQAAVAYGAGTAVSHVEQALKLSGRARAVVIDEQTGAPVVFNLVGVVAPVLWPGSNVVEAAHLGSPGPPSVYTTGADSVIEALLPTSASGGFALVTRREPQDVDGAGWCDEDFDARDPEFETCTKQAQIKTFEGFGARAGVSTTFGFGLQSEYNPAYATTRSRLVRWGDEYLATSTGALAPRASLGESGVTIGTMVGRFSADGQLQAFRVLWQGGPADTIQDIAAIDRSRVQILTIASSHPVLVVGAWILDRSLSVVGHHKLQTEVSVLYSGVPFSTALGRGGIASLVPGFLTGGDGESLFLHTAPSMLNEPWTTQPLEGTPGQVKSGRKKPDAAFLVSALGAAASDAEGAAILAVESGNGTRVLLTDRWGRTHVPDPDPCDGDHDTACSDGDPTTVDRCTAAGCVHIPATRAWAP